MVKSQNKVLSPRIIGRRLAGILLTLVGLLALIAGGGYIWALLSTETSLAARGIVWGESKYDDWKRFPNRTVRASITPVFFEFEKTNLFEDFTIGGKPLEEFLASTSTTAFVVLHDNALIYEDYFNGSSHDDLQSSLSTAKSWASTLVGIAIEEGFIESLDDRVTDYIPELLERDPRFGEISLRHLLEMRSGLRFESDESNPFSDDFITSHSPNMREAALNTVIQETPGWQFLYNDYNPQLIGMVLERATGMTVSAFLESRLWGPMGAEADGSWDLDSKASGFERMSVGMNGRAIDLAKLGWLYLHGGKNGDIQVIPADWVAETTNPQGAIFTNRSEHANYYRNYWWLDVENHGYYAEGNFCQFIYVYPASNLVLVRHGFACGDTYWTGLLGEMAQAIGAALKP